MKKALAPPLFWEGLHNLVFMFLLRFGFLYNLWVFISNLLFNIVPWGRSNGGLERNICIVIYVFNWLVLSTFISSLRFLFFVFFSRIVYNCGFLKLAPATPKNRMWGFFIKKWIPNYLTLCKRSIRVYWTHRLPWEILALISHFHCQRKSYK